MLLVPDTAFPIESRLMIAAVALSFMGLEYVFGRLSHHETHDGRESAASLAVSIGRSLIRKVEAVIVAVPFALAYEHRLFDFEQTSAFALLALFLASDFFYYWHHRASHRIRWLWATHCVHHSATRLNLTAAIRLGWTSGISGHFLFYLPLAIIGFHPIVVAAALGLNLVYQFFIHTELVRRLGPLEWVFNTPAHHRVHHASNPSCLDRNYGGVLIVFDRLFGTFQPAPAGEPLRYGLVGTQPGFNPLRIVFGEWQVMFRDAAAAPTWAKAVRVLVAPPGSAKALRNREPASLVPLSPSLRHHVSPGE